MKKFAFLVLLSLAAISPVWAQAAAAPSDRFFDSAGVRIRYVEQGSGAPVVLMHGYTGTLDRHFIANGVFANLAQDYRVIAIDLRGHGRSGKPHAPGAYGEEMARDVVRLLDHLQIRRAHIAGYSLGAFVAGRVATLAPDRLISVIYIASLPLMDGDTIMEKFAADAVSDLEGELPFKSLAISLTPPGSKPPSDDEIRKAVAPLVAANDVKALAALWRGYKTLAVTNTQLSAVKTPSIVLIGSEDVSAAGVAELNKTHPQIRTLVVEGAQHGGQAGVMRRPEFMSTLREFLTQAR
jgi:pimeloyl-ACP methyl ester carboxylesterase